jgi:hypothetical protein
VIKFIRKGGRIIPIKHFPGKHIQDELVNIKEVQNTRAAIKSTPGGLDAMQATYWKITKQRAKITGSSIAKRIARYAIKGIKKAA